MNTCQMGVGNVGIKVANILIKLLFVDIEVISSLSEPIHLFHEFEKNQP